MYLDSDALSGVTVGEPYTGVTIRPAGQRRLRFMYSSRDQPGGLALLTPDCLRREAVALAHRCSPPTGLRINCPTHSFVPPIARLPRDFRTSGTHQLRHSYAEYVPTYSSSRSQCHGVCASQSTVWSQAGAWTHSPPIVSPSPVPATIREDTLVRLQSGLQFTRVQCRPEVSMPYSRPACLTVRRHP